MEIKGKTRGGLGPAGGFIERLRGFFCRGCEKGKIYR
jgi:hypothetical protein